MEGDARTSAASPGIGRASSLPFGKLVEATERALAEEGFGVLCRIDVQATLKQKLGVDMAPYLILGACNPPLAHRALTADPRVGLMLPCNVVIRQVAPDLSRVEVVDARAMAAPFGDAELTRVAEEVTTALRRVLDRAVPS